MERIPQQRDALAKAKKKDQQALAIIHAALDESFVEKISDATSAKEAWDMLETYFRGRGKVTKVKLQSLRAQYEMMKQNEGESIDDYSSRLQTVVHQMRRLGKKMPEVDVMEKLLRSLDGKYDYIVTAIEEAHDLETISFEQLVGSLQAHEERLRSREESITQALQAKL